MPVKVDFVPTEIGKAMTARMRETHRRRGIYIASGPPGIGKTSALNYFAAEHMGQVAIVKTDRVSVQGVGARMALQDIIMALRQMIGSRDAYLYHDTQQIKHQLGIVVENWAEPFVGARAWQHRRTDPAWHDDAPPLTIVFDEAQTLSREAIEALRYWNDSDRCFGPFPVGLVFVGNGEFALKPGKGGQSVISAAVADRARHIDVFDYDDISKADLRMILHAYGITDEMAVAALIKHYTSPRTTRSLRRLVDQSIADLQIISGDSPINVETVNIMLAA